MSSLWGRFKAKDGPTPAAKEAPVKKDPNAPQPTPLELMLADAGPIRNDGSDKFFGFENFGSTCYANSIIQCLYYSVPFREQVVNFPAKTPAGTLVANGATLPRLNTAVGDASNTQNGFLSPTSPTRKNGAVVTAAQPPGTRPEDNKESPEYKKKVALAAGPVLSMDYENAETYGMSQSLFSSLKDIFEAIIAHQSRIGVVSPQKFLEILRNENEMFRTAMHQDAHEFLNLLLNEVVDNVEKFSQTAITGPQTSQDPSQAVSSAFTNTLQPSVSRDIVANSGAGNTGWVHELFEGTLTSETRCLTCENTSQRDEAFLDLSVDLEQHSSVTSCLRKFSEEEMLCERNKFHCDRCGGLQEAEKRMKVKRLPRILALHLKRFKYTEDLQRLQKLFHRVNYPYYLRLFNTTDDAEDPDRLYELYAVVVHIGGGPYHGHYVSVIKTQDRGWLLFDDEMVEPVDKGYVRNFFGGEGVLACAYVLFYQETTVEAMQKEQEAEGLAAAQKAAEREKEAVISGRVNGHAMPNGVHDHNPGTPTGDEPETQFANLAHAVSAPLPVHAPLTTTDEALEHIITAPTLAAAGVNLSTSSKDKKAAEKERKAAEKAAEKERKAAEKAAEKERKAAEKEREKDAGAKWRRQAEERRARVAQQEEELQAALQASVDTKAQEDRRTAPTTNNGFAPAASINANSWALPVPTSAATSTNPPSTAASQRSAEPLEALPVIPRTRTGTGLNEELTGKDKSSKGPAALSRFRHTSVSLRGKPKWLGGSGDKDTNGAEGSAEGEKDKDKKETKSRFSIGRKKSGFLS